MRPLRRGQLQHKHQRLEGLRFDVPRAATLVAMAGLLLLVSPAMADAGPSSQPPPPPGAHQDSDASEDSERGQHTGWDIAGLPLLNYSTDRGVGYGGYLAVFHHPFDGRRDIPYQISIGGQFYRTTGGYQFHKLNVDIPDLLGTGLRFGLLAGFEAWDGAWYFGQGNERPRLDPEATPENFYKSDLANLWAIPVLRIPLVREHALFVSHTVRDTKVSVYADSLLELDNPEGTQGGLLSQFALGWMVDKRDKEPNTTRGYYTEASFRGAHAFLGSDWDLWGANVTHRQWWRLRDDGRLVFAVRVAADIQSGGGPFFHEHVMGGSDWVEIGGNRVLRGLPQGRYRGDATLFSNIELRGDLFHFQVFGNDFDVMGVGYIDVARLWTLEEKMAGSPVHLTGGLGPRITYNNVFLLRTDFGVGLEEYTDIPQGGRAQRFGPVIGVYAMVNHPF